MRLNTLAEAVGDRERASDSVYAGLGATVVPLPVRGDRTFQRRHRDHIQRARDRRRMNYQCRGIRHQWRDGTRRFSPSQRFLRVGQRRSRAIKQSEPERSRVRRSVVPARATFRATFGRHAT